MKKIESAKNAMSPPAPSSLQVSCVRYERLHEPLQPLASNPVCRECAPSVLKAAGGSPHALLAFPTDEGYVSPLLYGTDTEWCLNLLEASNGTLETRGQKIRVSRAGAGGGTSSLSGEGDELVLRDSAVFGNAAILGAAVLHRGTRGRSGPVALCGPCRGIGDLLVAKVVVG
jgi:hypothetical protein